MFGFINPLCRTKKYRQLYCDACAHLRQNYGRWSTPFLSYESVLVHAMAYDAGHVRDEECVSPCRFVPIPKRSKATSDIHHRLGEFSSALTHLFVKTKIEDDILDDRSWCAKFVGRLYQSKFDRCVQYFRGLDSQFSDIINGIFKAHRELELGGSTITLTEYMKPTADAFGYVFGLLGIALNDSDRVQTYSNIGKRIGEATICADCGHDWIRDKKRGLYKSCSIVGRFSKSNRCIAGGSTRKRVYSEGDI